MSEDKPTEIRCECGGLVGSVEFNTKNSAQLVKEWHGHTFIWEGHGFAPCDSCGKLREWHADWDWLAMYVYKRTGVDITKTGIG